ncbi:unnamed protein product [Mytilus coruscus]|uniref:Uncharacterized protein n=1 Tax=Mytilus coruscus TaxID=42192 RepID=A0A6J8DZ00_MYTCO|nr:unnamed protein product [Mytilus coruscus]
MGRTRETRNRSLSPAPSVSVVRTPISSKPRERRDLLEVKSQVTPSKFFGKVGEDFESWIKIFDRISRANRWSDGRKGKMLPAYLRGRAADYFEDLDIEIQNDLVQLCKTTDGANKSEDKEDNTGYDIISIADTSTSGDMDNSSHDIVDGTTTTIIIV